MAHLNPTLAIQTHFADLEDFRIDRTRLHNLLDIVVIAICAVICGAEGWEDIAKYGVDVSNGDRIVYKHHTNPEFNIGRHRIRLRITTRDWHLRIVRHFKWWRKLPGWHRRETDFREWYTGLLDRVQLGNDAGYAQALRAFKCPEEVSGYGPGSDDVELHFFAGRRIYVADADAILVEHGVAAACVFEY